MKGKSEEEKHIEENQYVDNNIIDDNLSKYLINNNMKDRA